MCIALHEGTQDLSDRLGDVLKGIYVPETVALEIVNELNSNRERSETQRREQSALIEQRLSAVRARMAQIYEISWMARSKKIFGHVSSLSTEIKNARNIAGAIKHSGD